MNIFAIISETIIANSQVALTTEVLPKPTPLAWIKEIDTASLASFLAIIVALFVPIAILVYQDLNKKQEAGDVFIWEKIVALNQVVKSKFIFCCIIVASLIIIALGCKSVRENLAISAFLLLIFFMCIAGLIYNLIYIVKYLNPLTTSKKEDKTIDFRQKQKEDFLEKLGPNNLQIWNDVFGSINKSNPYQNNYLKIFLDKYKKAEEKEAWYYELCLTQNMNRLNCEDADIQKSITDFAATAFFKINEYQDSIAYSRRSIIRKLTTELAKNNTHFYSFSNFFDKKIDEEKLDKNTTRIAVENFSDDVLSSLWNSYNNEITKNVIVFPTSNWNILNLAKNRSNQKAIGLLNAYLYKLPSYIGYDENKINTERANFLDSIVLGLDGSQKLSKKIVRTLRLFFMNSTYTVYDDEDNLHIRVRTFIDRDYNWGLEDPCLSFSTPEGYNMKSKKQQNKLLEKTIKNEKEKRAIITLKILTNSFFWQQNIKEFDFKNLKKTIEKYDVYDEKYNYNSGCSNAGYNLSILKEVVDTVIKYKNQLG